MQTKDILALESASKGDIILHKEGAFWRVYQNSAFLFTTHIRPLKVNTKFVKAVQTEIAYVGFPDTMLDKVLHKVAEMNWKVEESEKQIVLKTREPFALGAFERWFSTHLNSIKNLPEELDNQVQDRDFAIVIRKLRSYPILEKSPLETQQFVLNLQKEINGFI